MEVSLVILSGSEGGCFKKGAECFKNALTDVLAYARNCLLQSYASPTIERDFAFASSLRT